MQTTCFMLLLQVMSIKAVGIAIKLTLEGSSQAAQFQTWVFVMVAITCVITQLNYLNKVSDFVSYFFWLPSPPPPTPTHLDFLKYENFEVFIKCTKNSHSLDSTLFRLHTL